MCRNVQTILDEISSHDALVLTHRGFLFHVRSSNRGVLSYYQKGLSGLEFATTTPTLELTDGKGQRHNTKPFAADDSKELGKSVM